MEAAEPERFDEWFEPDGHFAGSPLPTWGGAEAPLGRRQLMDILQACMDKLPATQGRIFMMRDWLELDFEAVCKELAMSATNVVVLP